MTGKVTMQNSQLRRDTKMQLDILQTAIQDMGDSRQPSLPFSRSHTSAPLGQHERRSSRHTLAGAATIRSHRCMPQHVWSDAVNEQNLRSIVTASLPIRQPAQRDKKQRQNRSMRFRCVESCITHTCFGELSIGYPKHTLNTATLQLSEL